MDTAALDHRPSNVGDTHAGNEQFGPLRAARALGIVHIALADATALITGDFEPLFAHGNVPSSASLPAAYAQVNENSLLKARNLLIFLPKATYDTLIFLYPSQIARLQLQLSNCLAEIPHSLAKTEGVAVGHIAAAAIVTARTNDGSEIPDPPEIEFESSTAGLWSPDPIADFSGVALGANWSSLVAPFIIESAAQFNLPPYPDLTSPNYTVEWMEVYALGGDGVTTPTVRNEAQTDAGIFWAYDASSLCAPAREYLQITAAIADQLQMDVVKTARLLGMVGATLPDAGLAAWHTKWQYRRWRPVVGIRDADNDGNPMTPGDATWAPFGAPPTGLDLPDFTPPFPAYPSGHATFCAAAMKVVEYVVGTRNINFTFVSDEFNGVTQNADASTRPLLPAVFQSLDQVVFQNAYSRILLGIHWRSDATGGIALGEALATYTASRIYRLTQK
jgi:membrane-associated phospholipid phosphatase